jgi:undecaprenyl diphosphate synthase
LTYQSVGKSLSENALSHQLRHVAIIMDGNGRWAAKKGLPRTEGHRRGVETIRSLVRHVGSLNIDYLTLYSFSRENWKRPQDEISDLMGLLKFFVRNHLSELHSHNVQVRVIGSKEHLSDDILSLLEEAQSVTKNNTGLCLVVAFNYGARQELCQAVQALAQKLKDGQIQVDHINEEMISEALDTHGIPDPDLIIRTSGEQRLSNFLLWQSAYSEFYFDETLWPDYTPEHFNQAVACFTNRQRRYGDIGKACALTTPQKAARS